MEVRFKNKEEFKVRHSILLREEEHIPENLLWLSFAEPESFLGVVIHRAKGIAYALNDLRVMGINPGGDVAWAQIPEKYTKRIKSDWCDRLLNKDECKLIEDAIEREEESNDTEV